MPCRGSCGSGLASPKGCRAAPAISAQSLISWGRFAALSRRKAAPTEAGAGQSALRASAALIRR
ncbi:hypothetical protein CQW31_13865 [Pseudomonas sp. 382]|nr:hypothetical protein CQW31_13865 [Pseudomonas sp. 382]